MLLQASAKSATVRLLFSLKVSNNTGMLFCTETSPNCKVQRREAMGCGPSDAVIYIDMLLPLAT